MQRVEAGALILGEADVIRLSRLALAGLPVLARQNGGLTDADRRLVEELHRAAQQVRNRERRRPDGGCATDDDGSSQPAASSAPTRLGTTEAAQAYGVSPAYIRRLASSKRLLAEVDGRGFWRVDADALAGWAAGRTRA